MDNDLRAIVEKMLTELRPWLDRPSETADKIARMKQQMGELNGALKTDGIKAAMKALDEAEAEAKRERMKEAAEAIAELCRPLGVRLEAREAAKRPGRKPGTKARGTKA
jgi:hypothetical protein